MHLGLKGIAFACVVVRKLRVRGCQPLKTYPERSCVLLLVYTHKVFLKKHYNCRKGFFMHPSYQKETKTNLAKLFWFLLFCPPPLF